MGANQLKHHRYCIFCHKTRLDYLYDKIVSAETEINIILPKTNTFNRSKRGLLDVVGEISKSLFGTGTVSDERILASNINKVISKNNLVK